ncbi:MAG: hypothetical protein E6I23_11455 [Chloroflexi bacterium]|nr:MAG: hypothetical protein AUH32_05735 [Actinobacteria bacterium 13_1_40CM_66_12]TMF43166.1 MAG: hypothetical protein E6I23_11455 [Chloroflexota bacterium]
MEKAAGRAQGAHSTETSRPETVFVLLLTQSIFWMVAGISALPFALGGELHMVGLGLATLLVALLVCLVAIGVLWRRRWARRTAIGLEIVCLAGSVLQLVLPIGANHAPVTLLTNVVVPAAVIWLLWGRNVRSVFS